MARRDEPDTVEMRYNDGRTKRITYANRREMVQYVGRSLFDNGYVKSKAGAQELAPHILDGPIQGNGGPCYTIVKDN